MLNELTRILPPQVWTNSIEIYPDNVVLAGEADQAAPLLKLLDSSPLFQNSDFALSVTRNGTRRTSSSASRPCAAAEPGGPRHEPLHARAAALILLATSVLIAGLFCTTASFAIRRRLRHQPATIQTASPWPQQRAVRLRQVAALVPAREAIMKQTAADLADRERGLIPADTAAQAQAALLEIARRVGKQQQIEVRGGEFRRPRRSAITGWFLPPSLSNAMSSNSSISWPI